MNSQPLPSKTVGLPSSPPRRAERLREIAILGLENETSVTQLISNPQRRPVDAQYRGTRAAPAIDATARALAAAEPKDLGRAKVILLGARIDCSSIGIGIISVRSRRKGPDLPICDLRGNADAAEGCQVNDATLCPELAAAINDPAHAAILVDHPILTDVWIALLKPEVFTSLNADPRFRVAHDHKQYLHDELFPERGAIAWLRRAARPMFSVLPKALAAAGGLTLLAHKLGFV